MTDESLATRIATSRPLLIAVIVVSALLALGSAVLFQDPGLIGKEKTLTDFDAFYIAGTMAREGQAAETYQAAQTFAAQQRVTGEPSAMPWTYPPPFTLFVAGLAGLPIGLSYLLFIAVTATFYVLALRRIAGHLLPGVLVAILPTLMLTVRTGQNGFLTGALVGWFLLAFLDRRKVAGVPLGLMVIKPHVAAGIALLALLGKRWAVIAIAAAIVIAALLLSTVAFGAGIWPAFLGGVGEAGTFLAKGYYPMFRMTSVYAWIRTLGGSPSQAIVLHAVVALAAVGTLLHLWRKDCPPRLLAAAACASSMLISPYNYDYDLTTLGLGIAFVMRDVIERARGWELPALLLLAWSATGYGLARVVIYGDHNVGLLPGGPLSLGAPLLIALTIACYAVLRRNEAPTTGGAATYPVGTSA